MKLIPLTQGQFAKVDDDDFERLSKFKWCARWSKWTRSFYAIRGATVSGSRRTSLMHREIMAAKRGCQVDHRSHDTLDNQKENLRPCSRSQNGANRGLNRNSYSGLKGVSFRRDIQKWRARLKDGHGKDIQLGHFTTAIEAACAYDVAALKLHGEFALTNAMLGLLP